MAVDVDVSDLRRLEVDLGAAPARAAEQVRKTVSKAALNIKKDMQREATGVSESFDRVALSISYDLLIEDDGIAAEIGPEIGHRRGHPRAQGSLAWIAYEGHATTAPVFPDPQGALDRESRTFQQYLAEAVAGDLL